MSHAVPLEVVAAPRKRARRPSIRLAHARSQAGEHSPQYVRGEKPLLEETGTDGTDYIATDRALYRREQVAGPGEWTQLEWSQVQAVTWRPEIASMRLDLWPDASPPSLLLPVGAHSRLRGFVQERLTAGQVVRHQVQLVGGRTALVTGQRDLATSLITWTVGLGPGCDPTDAALLVEVDRAVAELRAQLGC